MNKTTIAEKERQYFNYVFIHYMLSIQKRLLFSSQKIIYFFKYKYRHYSWCGSQDKYKDRSR